MMLITLSMMVFLSVASLAWAMLPDASRRAVRRRLYTEVSPVSRPSLLSRIASRLEPVNRRLPLAWYTKRIPPVMESAGVRLSLLEFLSCQEMTAAGAAMVYFALGGKSQLNVAWLGLFAVIGFIIPIVWLQNRIKTRRLTISRDLPEVADLLNLCVGAGSDFMTALGRIVKEFRPCPVREELGIVLQEIRMGKRRRDALRAFSDRLKCPEASTFARTLIQVDRMGTGLTEALEVLSEDMRIQRFNWAERFAQQAPMKMLIPLVFSLGAAMIIVAGPILIKFLKGDLMSPPRMSATSAAQTQ